ncbi:MAG TPA: hypothetical protein VFG08_10305, partial [Candidatus Polarisedimenticolia bacterium]|nr:hypothetical protein [Candidatus Polarisedimenticolia bacterium]
MAFSHHPAATEIVIKPATAQPDQGSDEGGRRLGVELYAPVPVAEAEGLRWRVAVAGQEDGAGGSASTRSSCVASVAKGEAIPANSGSRCPSAVSSTSIAPISHPSGFGTTRPPCAWAMI